MLVLTYFLTALLCWLAPCVRATKLLKASSLVTCMSNSSFSATNFDVAFYPGNSTVLYDVSAYVAIDGYVTADITVYAYGINILQRKVDPCKENINQLCPVSPGEIDITASSSLSRDVVKQIPGIAYTFPDLDVQAYVQIRDSNNTLSACIRVDFENGKTVDHVGVKWATAVISGIGLVTSAVMATMGSSYSAAHIAANSVALFGYFQSVVIICMESVERVPPITAAWCQNIAWSMGLIEVKFMQKIFRWYVQATGGSPTTSLTYSTISILVQRALEVPNRVKDMVTDHLGFEPSRSHIMRRASGIDVVAHGSSTLKVIRGIKRVGYQAGIEQTNIVLTGFTFFVLICLAMSIVFGFCRLMLTFMFKNRFHYLRQNWLIMLKGALLRLLVVGFPQLLILSFWEFLERDSAAVIVLAVFFLILSAGILIWNSYRVYAIGKSSLEQYGTPAYMLFSDKQVMNKYGFLYISFDASKYFFIGITLAYIFFKACFIGFAQNSGMTQGLAMFIIELAFLSVICWKKPYMDKSTNVINIIIQVVCTLNAMFFLFFSDLMTQPQAVNSIMGLIFFILNAAFSLVLLIYTLVTCCIVIFSKNPDSRYKPAKDDRASFIQTDNDVEYTNEFKALGEAAKAGHEDDMGGILSTPQFNTDEFDPANARPGSRENSFTTFDRNHGSGSLQIPFSFGDKRETDSYSVDNGSTLDNGLGGTDTTGHAREDSYTALNANINTGSSQGNKKKIPGTGRWNVFKKKQDN